MNDAGKRGSRPGANIGRRSGNCTCRRYPAHDGRRDVGQTLRDKFAIGAMAVSGHSVRDHGRQKRFNSTEREDGESGGKQDANTGNAEDRQMRRGKCGGNAAEPRSDRGDR